MATSLQSLLDEIIRLSRERISPPSPDDGIAALHPAGRALSRLAEDRFEQSVDAPREIAVRTLALACTRAADAWPATAEPRLCDLMGAVADAAGLMQLDFSRAARWAVAVAVSEAAGRCARVAQRQPAWAAVPQLLRVRRSAAVVEQLAAGTPPRPLDAAILDRQIPLASIPCGLAPHRVATEAAAAILDHLRRPARHAEVTLAQVLAVTWAAETAAGHAVQLAAAASRRPPSADQPWRTASTAWAVVRYTLSRSFDDGTLRRRAVPSELIRWSLLLHDSLSHSFDAATGPRAAPPFTEAAIGDLGAVVALLPGIADALHTLVKLWSLDGTLITRADSARLDRYGHRRQPDDLVKADRYDLTPVVRALSAAELLSTSLSVELTGPVAGDSTAGIPTSRSTAANLAHLPAAHQARTVGEDNRAEAQRRAEQVRRRAAWMPPAPARPAARRGR